MVYNSIEIRRFEIIALTMLLSFSFTRAQEENAAVYAPYYKVYYPPSKGKGGLVFGAEYSMWIPAGVKTLRGIIVHQHGCGPGAAKQGETAVYDLHWQALARKWDCALMGPSYKETEGFDYSRFRIITEPLTGIH
jgi:hypothetical protein